jgi:hypothetical protein
VLTKALKQLEQHMRDLSYSPSDHISVSSALIGEADSQGVLTMWDLPGGKDYGSVLQPYLCDGSVYLLVVPALDEEGAIGAVVRGFLGTGRLARVVVGDNGSRDATAAVARDAGAEVDDARRPYNTGYKAWAQADASANANAFAAPPPSGRAHRR